MLSCQVLGSSTTWVRYQAAADSCNAGVSCIVLQPASGLWVVNAIDPTARSAQANAMRSKQLSIHHNRNRQWTCMVLPHSCTSLLACTFCCFSPSLPPNAGSHLVDQALSLFGPPTSVTGLVLNQRHLPVCAIHDAFTITLHYERPEGPLTVLLRSSSLCKTPGARFSLHGTQVTPRGGGEWVGVCSCGDRQ